MQPRYYESDTSSGSEDGIQQLAIELAIAENKAMHISRSKSSMMEGQHLKVDDQEQEELKY